MNKFRVLVWLALPAIAAGGLFLLLRTPTEPSYQGRTLSQWIQEVPAVWPMGGNGYAHLTATTPAAQQLAAEAVAAIGTNAIPTLQRQLRERESHFKTRLILRLRKQSLVTLNWKTTAERKGNAVYAVMALGPDTLPMLGEFLSDKTLPVPARQLAAIRISQLAPSAPAEIRDRMVRHLARAIPNFNDGVGYSAMVTIRQLGVEATLPALTNALADRDVDVRRGAVLALLEFRHQAVAAIPALARAAGEDADPIVRQRAATALNDCDPNSFTSSVHNLQHGSPDVRAGAAWSLGFMGRHPQIAVPILISNLTDFTGRVRASAADALGMFGTNAQAAAPQLRQLLADEKRSVREAATNALRLVIPETAGPAGVK